ncbi:hypothetical protein SAMN04487911_101202 [Arenibacter nanhaiticus]|uniref:Uncharacterized protein n=1 Tax=Arenibacter nanhaiticus TaxID=558155 RepID=A0A1M6AFB9_9FLAO|nr:hypothetical protein [Arenibacter nanhaiticus]SHI35220.1 hypothetical protein SAMN04487911_101202 [Arenibacter nanhaiticus]
MRKCFVYFIVLLIVLFVSVWIERKDTSTREGELVEHKLNLEVNDSLNPIHKTREN